MDKFTTLTGVAAAMPLINMDTDKIIPARFLKTIKRTGLGVHLFNDMRYQPDGAEQPDFVLNRPPYTETRILVAGQNFGCGSSREHAPWALLDFGIRCVIAPSFADIFFNNCFKNGVLPIVLATDAVESVMADAQDESNPVLTVDLEAQEIYRPNGAVLPFDIDPFRRHCLLNGLDDIALSLQSADSVDAFEAAQHRTQPWLWR